MNKVLNAVKRLVPRRLKRRVRERLIEYFQVPTVEWSVRNIGRTGFHPAVVLDIGAYHGEWTLMAHEVFPEARFLMLEAQEDSKPVLESIRAAHPESIDYRIVVLGPEMREQVVFHEMPGAPTGSSMLSTWKGRGTRPVMRRMQTVDAVLAEARLDGADFIKIDVQGYELEVLKGAEGALAKAQVVLMEVSLIDLYKDNPLLDEVVAFMKRQEFVAYDICTLMRRPLDLALVQVDMMFVARHSSLLKTKEYGAGDLF